MQAKNFEKISKQDEYQHVFNSDFKKTIKSYKNIHSSQNSTQNIQSSQISIEQFSSSPVQAKKIVEYIFLDDDYYKLGEGSYGAVYKCYTRQANKVYRFALKIIKVPEYHTSIASGQDIIDTTRQQIKTLMKFKDNPNIIKIQDLIRVQKIIYLILEFCNDKDIISYFKELRKVQQTNPLKVRIDSMQRINFFIAELLNGFKDLTKYNITHRDIKPGNILVGNGTLKIADFGLSKPLYYKSEIMTQFVGTLCTAAPQIKFKEDYTAKCDIFSLGAVYYWMIYNKYPFKDNISKEEYIKTQIQYPSMGIDGFIITEQVKKLISSMLSYKEDERPAWSQLFSHRFFAKYLGTLTKSTNRISFDRGMSMIQSQDFNQQIPEQFYKYVNEKDLQMNRISVDQYQDFIHVMKAINFFNLKISFFQQLLRQLSNYNSKQDSQTQIQEETLCDIIRLGIQKYTISLNKKLQNEITFKDIPEIIDRNALKSLLNQEKFNIYSKDLLDDIHSYEDSQQRPKLSKDKISRLVKNCEQYKVNEQFKQILRDARQGQNQETMLYEINKAIMELIFLMKPEIKNFHFKKQQLKTSVEQNRFKYLVLLVHHLNMFVMHKLIFLNKLSSTNLNGMHSSQFHVASDFLKRQKFQDSDRFSGLVGQIQFLLDRFEE